MFLKYFNTDSKILIIDSIMGSGKTSAAINYINNSFDGKNFIYITLYLTEVERIKQACAKKNFIEPNKANDLRSKGKSFIELIKDNRNIVTTHALFSYLNQEVLESIELNNYELIIDESFSVIEPINISEWDYKTLLDKYVFIDSEDENKLIWHEGNYEGKFEDYKNLISLGSVYKTFNTGLVWNFPVEVFKAFERVLILTYMFEGQNQSKYFELNNIEYKYVKVVNKDGNYIFDKEVYNKKEEILSKDGKLINICDYDTLNKIIDGEHSLSYSWYKRSNNESIKKLKNAAHNYYQNILESKSADNMWTTFKEYEDKLKGKGYTKGFVPLNARATNIYNDKTNLVYFTNRYPNMLVKKFFNSKEIKLDEDEFALSEMLQWIYRSAIRNGEKINIYIPSERMRGLLQQWVNKNK